MNIDSEEWTLLDPLIGRWGTKTRGDVVERAILHLLEIAAPDAYARMVARTNSDILRDRIAAYQDPLGEAIRLNGPSCPAGPPGNDAEEALAERGVDTLFAEAERRQATGDTRGFAVGDLTTEAVLERSVELAREKKRVDESRTRAREHARHHAWVEVFTQFEPHIIEVDLVQYPAHCATCGGEQRVEPNTGVVTCFERHDDADGVPEASFTQPNGEPIDFTKIPVLEHVMLGHQNSPWAKPETNILAEIESETKSPAPKPKRETPDEYQARYVRAGVRHGLVKETEVAREHVDGAMALLSRRAPRGWFDEVDREDGMPSPRRAPGEAEPPISDVLSALAKLGIRVTMPMFATYSVEERRYVRQWLDAGGDMDAVPPCLVAEIARGELSPLCQICGERMLRLTPQGSWYRCEKCNYSARVGGAGEIAERPPTRAVPVEAFPEEVAAAPTEPTPPPANATGRKPTQCGNCLELGHNARSCGKPKVERPKKVKAAMVVTKESDVQVVEEDFLPPPPLVDRGSWERALAHARAAIAEAQP